jgi:alanyl-tRNA synthetase
MKSSEIRQKFLSFFADKGHKIVPSAPLVNKDDPTLMFINAGMNQFKDYFLGNAKPDNPRIADTQKCLRVSGKQNDLEDVGIDSYHHTLFEMLGNWSFGDYFKEEAIAWAWELLTKVYGIDPDRIYVTIFEGDENYNLERDHEATEYWKKWIAADRILPFNRKDNFWEMGDTGPCGPCSEIHVDLRNEEDRAKVDARTLVNNDHPQVVEIWNLVFIQFNRKADGTLDPLPDKHIDTGMGFERLTMALQGKQSNYDTDIFTPFIQFVEKASGKKYTGSYARTAMVDISMRVIVDHIRAVSFAIADGEMPSNTGAGYVIRRILRRAVRYYYSFLDIREPFLTTIVPLLASEFKDIFPELDKQKDFVAKVIMEEERSFLQTLEGGLKRLDNITITNGQLAGETAFELYDTFGFPIDLTRLIGEEKGWSVDEDGFAKALQAQKDRGRADAKKETGDWVIVKEDIGVEFVGYDHLTVSGAHIIKYRTVKVKDKPQYQVVIDKTPFYAESGGQVGDSGLFWIGDEKIPVLNTLKENDLTIHILKELPKGVALPVKAEVNVANRKAISQNHSAVHLMHAALHQVIGEHALQKGQLVDSNRLRFDFAHFSKLTDEEILKVETLVNQKIRENILLEETRNMPIAEAKASGATMLFGEKYGEFVRMITFDKNFSSELCGGTHVPATGEIGLFKILSESGIAAGVRRIEGVTAEKAEAYVLSELKELNEVRALFKTTTNAAKSVSDLQEENKALRKEIEKLQSAQAGSLKDDLKKQVENINGVNFLASRVSITDGKALKTLAFQLKDEIGNVVIVFGAEVDNKPQVMVAISESLTKNTKYHAGNMVRELAKEIGGGGGGQAFFAMAGGKDASGLDRAMEKAGEMMKG